MIQARYKKQYSKEFTIKFEDLGSLKIHPNAKVLAMLPPIQYNNIFTDLEINGQFNPIVLIEDDKKVLWIIDGRNRVKMLKELERDVKAVTITGLDSSQKLREYVRHSHVDDRNTTQGQRAITAAEEYVNSQKEVEKIKLVEGITERERKIRILF